MSDADGSIAHLLLSGDLNNAVELCLQENRLVDAILLGIVGGDKLLAHVQEEYFKRNTDNSLTRVLEYFSLVLKVHITKNL